MGHMEDHAAFVGTYTGCAQHELFLAEIVFMLAIVVRNLSLPWVFLGRKFNTSIYVYWFKFLLDYAFLVLPPLLAMTTLSDSLFLLTCVLTACLLTLLVFICCEYFASPDRPTVKVVLNRIIDEQHRPTTFVTYYRASVLLLVATAILAVDFPVFPRRHTKTEKYGHSLMDVGVAAFIFASALASRVKNMSSWEASTRRKNWNRWLRSSYVILPLIGITRTAILTFLDYPQHVTEYGVHWNFFYTLAVVKIISTALPKTYPLFWACTFGVLQQTMLIQGYEKWILEGDNQRDNFFTANAEGICSLMGYLTIYYISDTIGLFISKTGIRIKSWIECCWRMFVFSLVFFIMQRLSEYTLGPPSRRVVNMTYVFAQMSLLTFGLAGLLCVQLFSIIAWAANVPYFCIDDSPWSGVEPCLTVSVNKSGLVFFLLSNLFTGFVNFTMDTHHTDNITSLFVLNSYMLTLCVIVHFCSNVKIPRKRS